MKLKEKIKNFQERTHLLVYFFLAFTFGVFGPLTLYITNIHEFWFSIGNIWWIAVLGGLVLFTLCFGISLVFKGKCKDMYICLIFDLHWALYSGEFYQC